MKKTYKLILLHSIKYGLPFNQLLNLGLTYSQVTKFINIMSEEKLLDEDFYLTDKGNAAYESLVKELNIETASDKLLPQFEYQIEKMNSFDVYLPKKRK